MKAIRLSIVLCAVVLETLWIRIRLLAPLEQHIVETITMLLLTGVLYLVSAWLILNNPKPSGSRRQLAFILLAACVFRFTVWPLFPALSDDVYRYRWEGKLQAAGGDPYQARPADAEWAALRDETFPRVVGKDFKAGYGPLTELVERWTYSALARVLPDPFAQVFWFKLPSAIFDLLTIPALMALLAARGLPLDRVLFYAWAPSPIVEFFNTGHNDSLVVLMVLLALLLAAKERWLLSFAALALAAAAKLWPVLLFPLFVGLNGSRPQRWWQWTVAIPVFGVFALPYWNPVTGNIRFLSGFVGGWRNNDSLFGVLLWATNDIYLAKYVALFIIFIAVIVLTIRRLPLERGVLWTVVILLMVSSNCHPWYLTWFIPLLAFRPEPALLLWTALMPVAYGVRIQWEALGFWDGSTPMRWLIWTPVYGMLAWRAAAAGLRGFRARTAPSGARPFPRA